jgi:hypothetical protein
VSGVVALIVVLMAVPREWTPFIWYGLTAIGILVGFSTFFLFGSGSSSRPQTSDRSTDAQTKRQSKPPRSERQAQARREEEEARRAQQESESRMRERRRGEYRDRVRENQRREAENAALKDELSSVFAITDDQCLKRGRVLAEVLNRLFKANEIPVREAFDHVEQGGVRMAELLEGVVDLDGSLYLVEVKWSSAPLGEQEVTPLLVRNFNRGYPGGILIASSGFAQPAVSMFKEALPQKPVVLSELEEIVTLLERDGSLKEFLGAKINAALVDKDPHFKPLIRPRKT